MSPPLTFTASVAMLKVASEAPFEAPFAQSALRERVCFAYENGNANKD